MFLYMYTRTRNRSLTLLMVWLRACMSPSENVFTRSEGRILKITDRAVTLYTSAICSSRTEVPATRKKNATIATISDGTRWCLDHISIHIFSLRLNGTDFPVSDLIGFSGNAQKQPLDHKVRNLLLNRSGIYRSYMCITTKRVNPTHPPHEARDVTRK